MRAKFLLLVGFGVGYVLGARAGRARYNQIAKLANKVWNTPPVQAGAEAVSNFAAERYEDAREYVGEKVGDMIAGTKRRKSKARSEAAK